MLEEIYIGTDIEENARFAGKTVEKNFTFLNKIYTKNEIEYCFNSKSPAQHLCARFCAKEAVIKALTDFGIKNVFYSDIEILKNDNNVPYVKIKKCIDLNIKISISHCKKYSTATAIIYK